MIGGSGQAKIQNVRLSPLIDSDVGGFEIAMDDAVAMRFFRGIGNFGKQRDDPSRPLARALQPLLPELVQRQALDVIHYEEERAVFCAASFQDADDIWMTQRGEDFDFAFEAHAVT